MCGEENRSRVDSKDEMEFERPDCCGPMMTPMADAFGPESDEAGRWNCAEMMKKFIAGDQSTASCPMSKMFKMGGGMKGFGLLAILPGLLLVLVGVAIILQPKILVWLVAAASIFAGLMLLAAVAFFRRFAAGMRSSEA